MFRLRAASSDSGLSHQEEQLNYEAIRKYIAFRMAGESSRLMSATEMDRTASSAASQCLSEHSVALDGHLTLDVVKRWYAKTFNGGIDHSRDFTIRFLQNVYCYLHSEENGVKLYINSGGMDPSVKKAHHDVFVGFMIEIAQGFNVTRVVRRYSQLRRLVDGLRAAMPDANFPPNFPPKKFGKVDYEERRLALEQYFVSLLQDPRVRAHPLVEQFFQTADGPNVQDGFKILQAAGNPMFDPVIWRKPSLRPESTNSSQNPLRAIAENEQKSVEMRPTGKVRVQEVSQETLDSFNVPQAAQENKAALDEFGGVFSLAASLGVDLSVGLTNDQYAANCEKFGSNRFPEKPMKTFWELFLAAFQDQILMILIAAAIVSLCLGLFLENNLAHGWIEGTAILIAVLLVATVTAGNDYTKELQFRALEKSSQADEQVSALRSGEIVLVNPADLTVGDVVVLQAGDGIPADGIIFDQNIVKSNESALTGEAEEIKKSRDGDPFLLSSATINEGEEVKMMAIGVGPYSQWGKIRAGLIEEPANTPLQDKLEDMAEKIGYVGTGAAVCTFIAMLIRLFVGHNDGVVHGLVEAFIISITIIVVAIPEGLPLAVTISLAYSTRKMYKDQNLIRVLAACETMGNATDICSDKTGTLTENRMTVVEGWFGDVRLDKAAFRDNFAQMLSDQFRRMLAENVCVNRLAYLVHYDSVGNELPRPEIVGNATEGALIIMAKKWDYDYDQVHKALFEEGRDKVFAFNSKKKRSTAIIHRKDGSVRVFVKGASEWILKDCTHYSDQKCDAKPLTDAKRQEIEAHIVNMADNALRTLCIAHRDFPNAKALPKDWQETPPDNSNLILDGVVGIIDPLRSDVKEAVQTAQRAGITVRMVTGDNINTARAIARECGILTDDGVALEGPVFRNMTPKEVDRILPKLQVLARSSPEDKFLLVTRLNGSRLPDNKEDWEEKHPGFSWENDRDRLLPGYKQEWEASRPDGGQVVAVTGDGTNDAPALKAADVGMSMGITGTRVAKDASDIVILDDRFSSIVRATMWGRSVYDNIRRFLQFQLTVNVVALLLVFIGAAAGFDPPLNAVMMLWVNLIMDTMGALALGTEEPTPELLQRRPYKRNAPLISYPMIRNILAQSVTQLALLLVLLFASDSMFDFESGSTVHYTVIFNTFVFWQVFNEFNARSLFDDWRVFHGVAKNPIFIAVIFVTAGMQAFIVEVGGSFTKTTGLTGHQWLVSIAFGALAFPIGFLMRFIPVKEDPESFFDNSKSTWIITDDNRDQRRAK